MTPPAPDDLRQVIWELLKAGDEAEVLKAVELTRALPAPCGVLDELTAQCIFDVAFGVEHFGNDTLAIELYRRVLPYPVTDTKYVASAWFRIGVCIVRQGNLSDAMQCYREALRVAQDLPHMTTLAYFKLAELIEASEDYHEAAALYEKVISLLPHPDISASQARLGYARCSRRSENSRRAVGVLTELAQNTDDPVSAEAWRLLAEIAEENHNYAEAEHAYREMISNPHSDPSLRAAAAYRLASIRTDGN